MTYTHDAISMFLNTETGIKRTYETINKSSKKGLSLKDFQNLSGVGSYDIPFIQFLQQNFQTSDTNKDNILSKTELNKLVTGIDQQGMTQEQVYSLAMQSGYVSDSQKKLIEDIMSNFRKIDKNGDGKVSKTEVDSYFVAKESEDKKAALTAVKASDFSTFYLENTSTDTTSSDDTYSGSSGI